MDDQIGKVIEALKKRKMLDNTLIFFVSDNGGTRSNFFVGKGEVKGELPPNNGQYRDGKARFATAEHESSCSRIGPAG